MAEARPTVRAMSADDAPRVRDLLVRAFGRADEADLLDTLGRTGDLAIALAADLEDALAGVAVLCHLRAPTGALGLGPIAVSPAARHRGVGGRLIEASVTWARRNDATGIFVLGRPRYYTRFGFSVERAAGFEHAWPSEFMLAREIGQGRLAETGDLAYPPAFASLG